MAKRKKLPPQKPPEGKLDPKDPDFFKKLGSRGGNATKAKKPKNFYKRIAALSHPREIYKGGRPKIQPATVPES